MAQFEYKVIPAPAKGEKVKGLKTPEARFAHKIETSLNEIAAEGWEYVRAELLPSVERSGLTSSTTEWRTLLVFRRPLDAQSPDQAPDSEPDLKPLTISALAEDSGTAPPLPGVTHELPEAEEAQEEPSEPQSEKS